MNEGFGKLTVFFEDPFWSVSSKRHSPIPPARQRSCSEPNRPMPSFMSICFAVGEVGNSAKAFPSTHENSLSKTRNGYAESHRKSSGWLMWEPKRSRLSNCSSRNVHEQENPIPADGVPKRNSCSTGCAAKRKNKNTEADNMICLSEWNRGYRL